MKKFFAIMSLVASASILFTNCSRTLDVPSTEKGTFQIFAQTSDTRTVNDGLATKWVAKDSMNVFHAVTGTTTYGSNDAFTIAQEDLAAGKFYGKLTQELAAGTNYDWYVLYPYSKYYSTPASTSSCYFYLGSKSTGSAQIQNGNDSKAHLCGQYFPLYGKATDVASDATPALTMKQILSAIKVNVTNNSGKPLAIKTIEFTATEAIIGSFYLNIAGEDVVFTPSGATYVSNTAKLNVLDGAEIANGASASFYIGIKPFDANADDELTLNVNGYSKKLTLDDQVSFEEGTIKTLNFNYDKAPVVEPTTKNGYYRVEDASWLKAGDVVAIASTSENFAMSTTDKGNYRGITAAAQSADGDYKTLTISSDVQLFTLVEGNKTGTFSFCCINGTTAEKYIAASSSSSNNMASVSTKTDDASFAVSITSGIATVNACGTNTRNSLRYNSSSTRFSCYATTSTQAPVAIFKKYGNPGKLPCSTPVADPKAGEVAVGTTVTLSCTTTGATIYYTTDGTTPTTSSTVYSSAITVNEAVTIKAIATAEGYDQSEVATFAYTIASANEATVKFGTNNNIVIDAVSVTGNDDKKNSWTVTTEGTTSFTNNKSNDFSQIGSSKSAASSITFTTTLPKGSSVSAVEAKFGGFSGTSGTVSLKVGDTEVGTGSLSGADDVVVSSTKTASGTAVTVTVTDIAKGVKAYYIKVTYEIAD